MSRKAQSTHWDAPYCNAVHKEKLLKKVQKIETLKALLECWEARDDADYAYILELRAKLRSAECQLAAMSL